MDCALCDKSFQKSPTLLDHMRFSHGFLQPYQCFACLKRYASGSTLYRHRKSVCKGDSKINGTAIYTLPSFIRVSVDSWTPAVGDRLECIQLDDCVAVQRCGETVGFVPKSLIHELMDVLQHGKIYVGVRGTPVKTPWGLQVAVD